MLHSTDPTLSPMLRKLQIWTGLDEIDQQAVLALPHRFRELRAREYMVREGDEPRHSCLILDGYAIRHKVAGNGGRQIMSLHMRGDVVDLQNSLLQVADHNVETLTKVYAALIPIDAIDRIIVDRPAVGKAMWKDTLVDGAIFREWALNVGRRDARTRIAHLLCELAIRLEVAGLGEQSCYELPLTQEQLADALGLTSVHVNRTLKSLDADGLIKRLGRTIRIPDWESLTSVADFDSQYLHLDRSNLQQRSAA